MKRTFIALVAATAILASAARAQTAKDFLGPAGVVPLTEQQPPAKIIVDPPLAEPLSRGYVFIQYRAENLRIVPVFGPNALDVSPLASGTSMSSSMMRRGIGLTPAASL